MKIVFVSNFMNHHQLEVSKELLKKSQYTFIATEPIDSERVKFGYKDMNKEYEFVHCSYDNEENYKRAINLINAADVVIYGSCPIEMVRDRIVNNKLTFAYSERLFKKRKIIPMFNPKTILSYKKRYAKYKRNNYYLLCASAYSKGDYNWYGAFKNKCYKWGYFPKIESFDNELDDIIEKKNQDNEILWCGRFLDWKHPEYAIDCAKFLKLKNVTFHITMVGNGVLLEKIKQKINKENLENYISVIGALPYDQVQKKMRNAKIFLFTSDQNEGWGAVLNESMGNACCVVANKKIGSVPYMLNNENGYVYKNKKEFLNFVYEALTSDKTKEKCKRAYKTIHETWNAKTAVENFMKLVDNLTNGASNQIVGPCSKDD